jgi:ketosteroid isomerase-like protein
MERIPERHPVLANTPEEIHVLFLDAFNRADIEVLVSLYEPGATLVTGSGTAVGQEAIRKAYEHILADGPRMELETRAVVESGNGLAMLHASWVVHRGGAAILGLSTEVVRRQPTGSWLFVMDEPRTSETKSP